MKNKRLEITQVIFKNNEKFYRKKIIKKIMEPNLQLNKC
jgi:hypothetical protein